jgi:SAM-dependent methyltransferase
MTESSKISIVDIEEAWGFTATTRFIKSFDRKNLSFETVDSEKRDSLILEFLSALDSDLPVAGEHREQVWEKGWGENLNEFTTSHKISDLRPKYFSKIPQLRWNQQWITPVDSQMELHLFELLLEHIFEHYLMDEDDVYEFGCGTGHNLLRIREFNKSANLTGLDWARSSQKLINEIARALGDNHLYASHFDYFKPDHNFHLKPNSAVCTIASLEQTGSKFTDFIEYLLENKPRIVIHIEPIGEVLNPSILLDYLSLRYFKKRNYLDGLVHYVNTLAEAGQAEVLDLRRTNMGSFFIEGYTVFVWRPV